MENKYQVLRAMIADLVDRGKKIHFQLEGLIKVLPKSLDETSHDALIISIMLIMKDSEQLVMDVHMIQDVIDQADEMIPGKN